MATTTDSAIRQRIIDAIKALVPSMDSETLFKPYKNQQAANFRSDAEQAPQGFVRVFQVRDTGEDQPPAIVNSDIEERRVTFEIIVAYPQTHRWGADAALDRTDAMRTDQHSIEHAIGLNGRENFSSSVNPAYPDACWREGRTAREIGNGVDFLVITQTMSFFRSMP
jgi:hypothetical protein